LFALTIVSTTLVGADQHAGFLADFVQPSRSEALLTRAGAARSGLLV
jgi:hypothetical protein